MNQNELAEVTLEKESGKWQDLDEWNKSPSELEAFESGFKAAFTLLYPLLEKSLESLKFYEQEDCYGPVFDFRCDPPRIYKTKNMNDVIIDQGRIARSTIQEIEAALKEMGNEL